MMFYLEYPDTESRDWTPVSEWRDHSLGNVIVTLHFDGIATYDAVGALYDYPNSPVGSIGVHQNYIREKCRPISRNQAKEIHPLLIEWLDNRVYR